MLKTINMLLPALIPSWRFFDTIAPSSRIEFTTLRSEREAPEQWQEFRPKPARLPMSGMLKNMVWNPRWNETLFLVSCAERLMEKPTEHSRLEIVSRIKTELALDGVNSRARPYLQFRLISVSRVGGELQKHITFMSPVYQYFGNTVP